MYSQFGSPSSAPLTRTHDVFLSFRGADTRYSFTSHLYRALAQKGIDTFIDDDDLTRGEEISEALLRAIEGSKLSLIVFSENYAFSKWCLDELVHILECRRSKNQMVWPIFYKVDPSDVRHQRGSFGKALAEHERRFRGGMGKVSRWRAALSEAANLSGWHFSDGHESKFLVKLIEEISAQLINQTHLNVANFPVGIESRVQDMIQLLDAEDNDVRMVGMCGIGGIGKTTIAKAVYNSIGHMFDGRCFLENVRENSMAHDGLVKLQRVILSEIVGQKILKATKVDKEKRFGYKRILLVLDDVNQLEQLDTLAGLSDLFGWGSKVIITTRNQHLLAAYEVSVTYNVRELNHREASELFCLNAFKKNRNFDDVKFPIDDAVQYARGLPLALIVLGSHLNGKSIKQWQAAVDSCRNVHTREIQELLKISFNALEGLVKEVFLDIACFFKGVNKNHVTHILEGCGLNPKYCIEVLIKKAFIYFNEEKIWMHDLLEEMAKEIVVQGSPLQAYPSNVNPTELVKLDMARSCMSGFKSLQNLKSLSLKGCNFLTVTPDFSGFPTLEALNLNFCSSLVELHPSVGFLDKLVSLSLKGCHNLIWFPRLVKLKSLRDINLSDCYRLKNFPEVVGKMDSLTLMNLSATAIEQLPDFSGFPTLEDLNLNFCSSLVELHPVGFLDKLVSLNLNFCSSLVELHPSVGFLDKLVSLSLAGCHNLKLFPRLVKLKSLRDINLRGCSRLKNFPEVVGKMDSLTLMNLSDTAIEQLPDFSGFPTLEALNLNFCSSLVELHPSVGFLDKLVSLSLKGCHNLKLFPRLVKLKSLRDINLSGCKSLENFPEVVGKMDSLTWMNLSGTAIEQLPAIENDFTNLKELNLAGCEKLMTLPCSIYDLQHLNYLCVQECKKLALFPNIVNSKVLSTKSKISFDNYRSLSEAERDGQGNVADPGLGLSSGRGYNLLLPELVYFNMSRCRLSDCDFLVSLDCSSTLLELDLSGNNFVSLPECITKFVNLKELYLCGCKRLREIQELPPCIKWLELKDCVSLERISKLSNILNDEESEMMEWMDLSNCRRLCDTLFQMAKRNFVSLSDQISSLFSFFLYFRNSSFGVVLPGNEIPKWFGWHRDFNRHQLCEQFPIEIPSNFIWENTGLAISVVFDPHWDLGYFRWSFDISINEARVTGSDYCIDSTESAHVWLQYIPFNTFDMGPFDYKRPLPPFRCQVSISSSLVSFKSCGVHLVMPPNEDVCMTASATDNLRDLPKWRVLDWPGIVHLPLERIPTTLIELNLSGSVVLPLRVAFECWKNLTSISFESCLYIKKFPDTSGLPNLENLNLNDCTSLVELDDSVGELDNLVDLSLSGCLHLITFPRRITLKSVKRINFKGCRMLESLPEIVHEMECLTWLDLSGTAIKELPSSIGYLRSLEELVLKECEKLTNLPSNIYELQHLWCLDLQNCSNLAEFPEWSSESLQINPKISHDLWYLNLRGCKRLEEIPELPPKVEWINVADCLRLRRFAKLSNILVHKESEMIKCITMFNCQRLCDSLALEMAENGNILLNEVSLCFLFLSCKQSEFDIVFPGSEVPKWFSCRKDLMELIDKCEFSFEIPPNFNLGNRGFAICAAAAAVEHINPEEKETMQQCSFTATIDINADRIVTRSFYFEAKDIELAHVWLCYIPFVKFVSHQSPPFKCGVSLEHTSQGSMRCKSFGVHLVILQDEDEDEDEDEIEDEDEDEDEIEDEKSVGKN